jgi:ATP-dependent exoDNAse (exonuclease V) alpha subunit
LIGDDRQLSSIERGGMFGVLKDRHGAAVLAEVRRQHKNDDRRAAELMAEGNFHDALARYDTKGAIHWTRTQPEARAALVAQWAKDNAADPSRSRFIFAYTNADVDLLNGAIRHVRKKAGQLEQQDHSFDTKHGRADFSAGDRVQFTGTNRQRGLYNGQAGTVQMIDGSKFVVLLDGRVARSVEFDAKEFQDFRHGYAGTIYKGQGRTLDQTYLYHSEHWRSAAGYVALTRHRDKAELFVARNTAPDLKRLARQIARVDERRAALHFHEGADRGPLRPLTPRELAARLNDPAFRGRYTRQEVARQQQEESDRRQTPAVEPASRATRASNDAAYPLTSDERKSASYKGRYTSGDDRPPDERNNTGGRERGGRGGRTR